MWKWKARLYRELIYSRLNIYHIIFNTEYSIINWVLETLLFFS